MSKPWMPYKPGLFRRWVLQQLVHADWAGSSYRFLRDSSGDVMRFWTHDEAQQHADAINPEPQQ